MSLTGTEVFRRVTAALDGYPVFQLALDGEDVVNSAAMTYPPVAKPKFVTLCVVPVVRGAGATIEAEYELGTGLARATADIAEQLRLDMSRLVLFFDGTVIRPWQTIDYKPQGIKHHVRYLVLAPEADLEEDEDAAIPTVHSCSGRCRRLAALRLSEVPEAVPIPMPIPVPLLVTTIHGTPLPFQPILLVEGRHSGRDLTDVLLAYFKPEAQVIQARLDSKGDGNSFQLNDVSHPFVTNLSVISVTLEFRSAGSLAPRR